MSEEEARREAAILAYEAEGNRKVQANMRRMQEQGVIKVARPSRVVMPASTAAVVASSRRLSLRSSARAPSSPASNADASCAPWSWENDDASNDSFSDPAVERGGRGDSPAGPAFVKIILPKHVGSEGRLPAPAGLADFLPPTARSLALVCDGESWRCTWSVGHSSAAGASLAGNWRGFVEDQQLEPGDAVTLKKEAGAVLRVTIHRKRSRENEPFAASRSSRFGDASISRKNAANAKTNATSSSSTGVESRDEFFFESAWRAAFAEAAALTDALFANHGAKPGAAVVDAGAASSCRPGGGTDPATHAHSRRTRGAALHKKKSAAFSDRPPAPSPGAVGDDAAFLVAAKRGDDGGVVAETNHAALSFADRTPAPALDVPVAHNAATAFASPRPAERTRDGAEREGEKNASLRDAPRRFANESARELVSFFSPEATPAPPSTGARACAAARAARDAGLRAPLRAGETRRSSGSSPRNPMETPATPTSAPASARTRRDSSLEPNPRDVKALSGLAGFATTHRCADDMPPDPGAASAGGPPGGGGSAPEKRARRGAKDSPSAGSGERVFAAAGVGKNGATRRQTPRFVSSAVGAAPMEGWATPAPGRGTRQTRHAPLAKTRQTKLGEFVSTPEGTPLSQVFKATKSFGGVAGGAAAAFVTPVEKTRPRAAAESPVPGAAVRVKRRRA